MLSFVFGWHRRWHSGAQIRIFNHACAHFGVHLLRYWLSRDRKRFSSARIELKLRLLWVLQLNVRQVYAQIWVLCLDVWDWAVHLIYLVLLRWQDRWNLRQLNFVFRRAGNSLLQRLHVADWIGWFRLNERIIGFDLSCGRSKLGDSIGNASH